jgi:hypothetical protein
VRRLPKEDGSCIKPDGCSGGHGIAQLAALRRGTLMKALFNGGIAAATAERAMSRLVLTRAAAQQAEHGAGQEHEERPPCRLRRHRHAVGG